MLLQTGLVDYEKLEEKALEYRPKLIICGGSAYTREWNYARFRDIADKVSGLLLLYTKHELCQCNSGQLADMGYAQPSASAAAVRLSLRCCVAVAAGWRLSAG